MSGVVKFTSKIGFGTMGLTWTPTPPPEEEAFTVIKEAIDSGIDLIVSGEFYGINPPEANLILLQKFFTKYPELRSKVKISVKGGVELSATGGRPRGDEEFISVSINNILKYLKYIDIFECARVDTSVPIEDTIRYIKKYVDAGKVHGISLSEVSAQTIKRAASVAPISAVEIEFSLWATHILKDGVYETCQELGIPILAYSPLGRGFLTGSYQSFADAQKLTDMRSHFTRFSVEEVFNHNLSLLKFVEKLAEKKGVSSAQISLAWILKHKGIVPIPGTSKVSRLHENLDAEKVELTDSEFKELNDFLESFEVKGHRYNEMLEGALSK